MDIVASVVGRQAPLVALAVPLVLAGLVDGRRCLRETWVPALACGTAFTVAQFAPVNYASARLAEMGAALAGAQHWPPYRTRACPPSKPYAHRP
ncbi:L-lactate permease [Streptomyces rishiriensis]|uniref:L-lactate permease n=1 Tax=Streptomyces rishiriensis TaxID=68264 RepID=A0ABU0NQJ0_STRRH|nr:L-lactate permease [Streptomyces rishiriensis]